jgi:hypothetical protein
MAFGSICCAKLAGIKTAATVNRAPCQSTELRLKGVERGHSEFIAVFLFLTLRPGFAHS